MWASPVEAACAAHIMGISLYHKYKRECMKIGHGPIKGILMLKDKHYTLYRLHGGHSKYRDTDQSTMTMRAGMRPSIPWSDWQTQAHEERRRHIMTTPLIYAFDVSPVQPGARMILRREDTVGAMTTAASMALGVPPTMLAIMESQEGRGTLTAMGSIA